MKFQEHRGRKASRMSGLTLIELIVVVGIIAVLIALIVPAVQAARESARRLSCSSNLKQIGLALQLYHDANGSYPSSFWRKTATGKIAPGGVNRHSWCSMMLPYVEQRVLHDSINFSVGISGGPGGQDGAINHTSLMTPLSVLTCPSDPSPTFSEIPRWDSGVGVNPDGSPMKSGPKLSYQCNLGDNYLDNPNYWPFESQPTTRMKRMGLNGTHTGIMSRSGGTSSLAQVTDGLSSTFLVGESIFESCNWFTWPNPNGTISSSEVPLNLSMSKNKVLMSSRLSSSNFGDCMGFRSSHPGIVQFVFCDGHVANLKESIDRDLYRRLSTRGQAEMIPSDGY